MSEAFGPQNWVDIIGYAVVGLPSTAAAIATLRFQHRAKRHRDDQKSMATATFNQVTNNHGTNLRDDIDELAQAIRDGFSDTRRDIGGLREELRTERIERIAGDRINLRR